MPEFELIFEVDPLSETHEASLVNELDVFVGGHGPSALVTITFSGETATQAALAAASRLRDDGVAIRRLVEDLVTRSTIAERSGKTPQAVGLWARGERHSSDPFPAPYFLAGGGLWLWGEVNGWLARQGYARDPLSHPARADYARVNGALQAQVDAEEGSDFQVASGPSAEVA